MGNSNSTENKQETKNLVNHAILDYSNGERYKGEIFEGLRNGFGIYFYANGERFEGNWFKNMKHGRGTFFYKNGEVYEGMWHNNKREGVGTYYYNNGDRYYGEWKENKKHGRGIINYGDGGRFIGQFKNNKKNGIGELIKKDGDVVYEEWADGKLLRQSEKLKYTQGKKYDIDYNQLNTGTFEKYLETKTRQQYESKSNQIKSKYFTIEFAKKLKSKNIENYYDSVRMLHSTNNLILDKPDMNHWTKEDVCEVFNKLGFEKYTEKILEHNIDGKMLLQLQGAGVSNNTTVNANINSNSILDLSKLLEISDNNEAVNLNKSLGVLKKLNMQTENLKSIHRNLNSIMIMKDKRNGGERVPENPENEEIDEEKNMGNKSEDQISEKDEEGDREAQNLSQEENIGRNNIGPGEKLMGDRGDRTYTILNINKSRSNPHLPLINHELLNEITSSSMNSVNLNGLNYFINYDELTLQMKVGEGGFGEVFQGVWHGKKVAVKKLTVKNSKFIDNLNKFINEINIISSLRHPNIVLYMGASIERDNYYMITEYLPKGSLFDYIHRDKGKITEREQIIIAYEIAVALKYLHSRNIIHCDLKSSNILIDDNWKIKVGDFGLSRFFNTENPEENRGRIGTPHWMAPEILRGEKYEHSADIFSFGMILWELLSLEIPYYGVNPYQVISLVADQRKIVPVPKEGQPILRHLTELCLQYEAYRRPKLDDIVDTLEKLKNAYKIYDTNMDEIFEYLN
jgi:tRNA A-37 threonylcarbamoyl transferase component Bud32